MIQEGEKKKLFLKQKLYKVQPALPFAGEWQRDGDVTSELYPTLCSSVPDASLMCSPGGCVCVSTKVSACMILLVRGIYD